MPALWSAKGHGANEEYPLGDMRQVPKSIQVFNACLHDRVQEKSFECGLGLFASSTSIEAHTAHQEPNERIETNSRNKPSLRSYANCRLEHQKHIHDLIESTNDVDRLLWEAHAAFSTHKYTLAAVLYRRAAHLGDAYACTCLAKLFGYGIVRTNQSLFLFERDSLRGVAWSIAAFQRITRQLKGLSNTDVDYGAVWSLLDQTLALLCVLLCAPETCKTLPMDEYLADISLPLLLLFPRSCELYNTRKSEDSLQAEGTRLSVWTALRTALDEAQDMPIPNADDDPSDAAPLESMQDLTGTHMSFLQAYLVTRTAFLEKSTASMEAAYESWTMYLKNTKKLPHRNNLSRYRRVACEGQQWAAPNNERKVSAAVSDAELSALTRRISSIFPFAYSSPKRDEKETQSSDASRTPCQSNVLQTDPQHTSAASKPNKYLSPRRSGPALLTCTTIAPATSLPSQETITVQTPEQFAGISSYRLRNVAASRSQRSLAISPSQRLRRRSSNASISSVVEPSYLTRMNDEIPAARRRRSPSIVSASPSLLFPSTNSDNPDTALCEEPAIFKTKSQPQQSDKAEDSLRARLKRQ